MTQTMQPPTTQALPVYEITEQDKKRLQAIASAWQAYDGLLDPPLQKMPDGTDPNVMSNRMGPIVDRGIDFLFGKELEISVEEDAPKEAQDFLNEIWGRKEARIPLLQDLAMNGAMAGRAFLRIVPTPDGSFRLVVVDPATVFAATAPQDCETVQLYCIEYATTEKRNGKPVQVYYREEMSRIDLDEGAEPAMQDTDATWQIQHWTREGERGQWQAAGEPIEWPYPFAPLFSCKNLPRPNDFWGKPDITPDLIGVNKSLNLTQSCINLVNILYGHPILYATGTGEQVIDIKPGKIIGLPLGESKIVAVPIASDMANALAFTANLRSDIDEQSATPGVATGRISDLPRGNMSGIAIELLFMPLLLKSEKKRCLYGNLLIEVSKALLVLNKMSEDIDITLAWQNPLPHDDLQSAQYAVALKGLSVSDTTLLRNLGFDPEEEAALSAEEDAKKMTLYSQGRGFPPSPPTNQAPPEQPQAQAPQSPFIGRDNQGGQP